MTRPYSLFIKSNGYYYVQFLLSDGSRSQNKSTGTKKRREAEKLAMEWYINGNIPARINSKEEKAKFQTVERLSFFNSMATYEFSSGEVDKMLSIYEKSPYVKELALEGKIFSRSHVKNERSRIENYWIPELKGMTIGSLTNEILKQIVSKRKIQSLAGKTINGIVEAITTPLKWAIRNQYIDNISLDGLDIEDIPKPKNRVGKTLQQYQKEMDEWLFFNGTDYNGI